MMFGSHLSVAGGLVNALDDASRLRLDTVQVFTKNQRQWTVPPLDSAAASDWLAGIRERGWTDRTVAHDSYLINLASPDDSPGGLWEKSIASMRDEIERAATLSIPFLVSHPGAHMIKDGPLTQPQRVEAGLVRIARAYQRLFKETRGMNVMICLENTAGGGTTLGRTFEELARLRELILDHAGEDAKNRVGFCVDTCHALAAGYDISAYEPAPLPAEASPPSKPRAAKPAKPSSKKTAKSPAKQAANTPAPRPRTLAKGLALGRAMLELFDRVCGLENLRVLHLNDSIGALGSRIDRHTHIGMGNVAPGVFAAVITHPVLAGRPMILETPKEEDDEGTPMDTVNLKVLKKLARSATSSS